MVSSRLQFPTHESEVWHVYAIANSLIERMDLKPTEANPAPSPSAAFSSH